MSLDHLPLAKGKHFWNITKWVVCTFIIFPYKNLPTILWQYLKVLPLHLVYEVAAKLECLQIDSCHRF